VFDEDFEAWKFAAVRTLKPADRKKLNDANDKLRAIYVKLNQTILDLKSRVLSLSPDYLRKELLRDPAKIVRQTSKSVLTWYQEFIKAKEKEIGEGINSYQITGQGFRLISASNTRIGAKVFPSELCSVM
jgi:hypothetical protein